MVSRNRQEQHGLVAFLRAREKGEERESRENSPLENHFSFSL